MTNRGGMGWQEPFVAQMRERIARDIENTMRYGTPNIHAAARAPVPADTIDMIEIDGVWMSPADAHAARLQIGRAS